MQAENAAAITHCMPITHEARRVSILLQKRSSDELHVLQYLHAHLHSLSTHWLPCRRLKRWSDVWKELGFPSVSNLTLASHLCNSLAKQFKFTKLHTLGKRLQINDLASCREHTFSVSTGHRQQLCPPPQAKARADARSSGWQLTTPCLPPRSRQAALHTQH